jgi:hypothetical protein
LRKKKVIIKLKKNPPVNINASGGFKNNKGDKEAISC